MITNVITVAILSCDGTTKSNAANNLVSGSNCDCKEAGGMYQVECRVQRSLLRDQEEKDWAGEERILLQRAVHLRTL